MALDLETIGVAFDTSGLEKGARALKDAEKAAHGAADAADKAGRSGRSFGAFGSDASKAADALNLYASSAKSAIDHQKELMRILDRANPAAAAARQLSDEVQTLNRALREGAIGNDTYRTSMRNVFDEAEKAAGGVSKVGSTASMVTGLLTKAAGALAVAFSFKKFIDETIAAEQAQAQLDAVLKSTGESAGWTSDQLNAMAQGLSAKSIFSVDQIKAAETRLLSYTGIVGEQFPRAMQAVVDMSSRMGMDVTSAAEQIGRALDIPSQGLTALTRQGFRFTEEQKELVKQLEETGRVAEAQAIVLSAVESSYGGAAEAARGTFGGALKELQKSINDLMTGEGGSVTGLTSSINGLNDVLQSDSTKRAFSFYVGLLAQGAAEAVKFAGAFAAFLNGGGVGGAVGALTDKNNAMTELVKTEASLADSLKMRDGLSKNWLGRVLNSDDIALVNQRISMLNSKRDELLRMTQEPSNDNSYGSPNADAMARAAADSQAKADATRAASRIDALNKLMGVNSAYQEELKKTQAALASGAITQDEYVASLKKLATETYAATDAGKAAAAASKANAKSASEAQKEAEREAQTYLSFVNGVKQKIAAQELELALGEKVNVADKERLKLQKLIADGKIDASRADSEETKALLAREEANDRAIKNRKALIDIEDRHRSALQDVAKAEASRVDAIGKSNDDLREQIAVMGLTNEQIRKRTVELNKATIAEKEQQLARLQSGLTNTREQAALEESIRALKERNELLSDQGAKEAQIAAQQEMLDMWQSVDRTAHDVFVNIFEDGAGTFKRLGQTLKAALLDMLYQMTVKRWIINIGASMGATGGIFAAGSAMAGQGGSGGVGNLAGSALNMAGGSIFGAGGLSGALMGGAGWLTGATTFGGALGAAGSLIGTGTAGGLASGLAMGAGALAPIALGVGLLGSALGLFRSLERKGGGLIGTLGQAGGVHDVDLMRRGGSLFSGPDWFTQDRGVSALDRAIQQQFSASKDAIKGFAETLGLSTEKIDGFTTALGTQTMGDHGQLGIRLDKDGKPLSDQEIQTAIAEAIKAGSNELAQQLIGTWTESIEQVTRTVVQTTGGEGDTGWNVSQVTEDVTRRTYTPSEFARDGEQAIDTLTRLAVSLQGVNGMFDTLGHTLLSASLASGDVASKLVDAFGGLDKMQAAAASYFQNFYSEEERAATLKRQLTTQLGTLGFDLPGTREAYRQLVDAQDITTEAGRKNYAALMQLSEAFAQVTPAAGEAAAGVLDLTAQAAAGVLDLTAQLQRAIDTLPDFADISAGALQELSKLFGGLDELTGAYGRYMDNFFTQQERQTVMFAQLGHDLRGLGIDTVPRTREEFRALVESLDLSTDSGRAAFAALIKLSPAFAQLVPAIDAVASAAATSAAAMIASANAAAQALVEVERDRLQALAAVASESANAADEAARVAQEAAQEAAKAHSEASAATDRIFGQLSQKLSQAMGEVQKLVSDATSIRDNAAARRRQLLGEMADTRKMGAEAANAFLNEALRAALGGGRLPKPQDMANAIDDAIAGLDVNTYKSVAQYEADKAILAAKLGALAEVSDQQVSEGERQVELLQKQMDYWRQQIDILRGTQGSITSIDDGIAQLGQLIAAESAAAAANTTAQSTAAAAQSAATAAQAAAQAAATVAGQYNTKPAGAAASEFDRQVAAVRNASWYGNGDWQQARGLKLSVLSAAMGVDPADLAKVLIDQGLSLKGDLITTRQALGDVGLEADAIRRAAWYGSGNWDDARGSTLSGLAASMGVDPRDLERRLAQEGLYVNGDGIILSRRYAQGGQHAGGWRLVGEQGPEVEFTGPARYWSFDQSKAMLSGGGDNAELVAENRALRQKVDELIARVERVASATEMSARLMDRVTANGNAMRTETA